MTRKHTYTADNIGQFEIKVLLLLNTDDDYIVEVCRLALTPNEDDFLTGPDGNPTTRREMRAIVAGLYNKLLDD